MSMRNYADEDSINSYLNKMHTIKLNKLMMATMLRFTKDIITAVLLHQQTTEL